MPVQRQLKQEFGFRTIEAGVRTVYAPTDTDFAGEAVMLTGDLNVAVVEWIVQHRVSNPSEYLFKVRNLEETFHAMNEAIMREVVGDRTVTEVLTVGRQEIDVRLRLGSKHWRISTRWGSRSTRSCSRMSTRPIQSSPPGTRSTRRSSNATG